MLKRDGGRCGLCGGEAIAPEVHHVQPVAAGGEPFDMANAVTACRACHQAHHAPRRSAEAREWDAFVDEL